MVTLDVNGYEKSIRVVPDGDEAGSFCFHVLSPSDEDVVCETNSADADCCNGGNQWGFPSSRTESKCGSLSSMGADAVQVCCTIQSTGESSCADLGQQQGASPGGSQGCSDNDKDCATLAGWGYCDENSEYYGFMVGNCRKTCGICGMKPTLPSCSNTTADNSQTGGPVSSHILDTNIGLPAKGITITMYRREENNQVESWCEMAAKTTDDDGRASGFTTADQFVPGVYKLHFETADYYKLKNEDTFYPYVEISFSIKDTAAHYHVPLLLTPFGYTTYRGS